MVNRKRDQSQRFLKVSLSEKRIYMKTGNPGELFDIHLSYHKSCFSFSHTGRTIVWAIPNEDRLWPEPSAVVFLDFRIRKEGIYSGQLCQGKDHEWVTNCILRFL